MAKTVADLLIERLIDWEVDTIFGFPGDGINGIFESLRTRQDKIRFIQNIDHVGWPHDALVVRCDVHKKLVQIYVLLVMRADQIMERMTRDGEHRLPVAFRVV